MPAGEPSHPVMRPYLAAAKKFAAGTDTPRLFLERSLELFALWEPRIGAFVCTNLPAARAAAEKSAERWRAGKPLSAIDGIPVGIKDIIETADMPTEMGSPLFAGWRSEKDAANVRALRDAGAVILGKTVTTEFAASEPRGTRNPWNTAHTLGGSSSGSAASVAAGHRQRRARHASNRLDYPAGELLRLFRLQAERERAQSRRLPRLPEPKLHRHSRCLARRRLAGGA
jgi:Asp-tRNA(Asn)/Glu-tRNA(Gln) amidotransferase A subunit family amidase